MSGRKVDDIYLGAFAEEDAYVLHSWRKDPEVRDGALGYPFPSTVEAEREWIRALTPRGTPNDLCLAIRLVSSDAPIGYCQLRSIDWVSRSAELGLVIGARESRRVGLGKQALALVMAYSTKQLSLRRLWLRVAAFNTAAISLYEQAGFLAEGRLVRHVFRNGVHHDVLIYGWEGENVLSQDNPAEARTVHV